MNASLVAGSGSSSTGDRVTLTDLERAFAAAEGRRSAIEQRHAELDRTVGLAKGRIAIKGDIETFLEQIQREAFGRATHSYETMLTALVQDVLPNSNPVALELTTERSAPALNISSVGPNGTFEDIFEDHGGALSNVISMGLRLIATIKSGSTRFLALDEPECWVKPDRVPAFFHVLEDSARRLGIQAIVVTHHDAAANFDDHVRVSSITGQPTTGTGIMSSAPLAGWDPDAEGFRYIRLTNFQGFADTRMDLAPGVNALVGPNDHGKSAVIRALRAVFYGETRDSLIRHGTRELKIEIGIAGDRFVRFTRDRRRNPKNMWSLHEASGDIVEENGIRLSTGGASPPVWLDHMFGLLKGDRDRLDIHLAHQKYPVFLLDKPGQMRAKMLSIGQEAGYTQDMLSIHKERSAEDSATVRDGEREIGPLRETLAKLAGLPEIGERIAQAHDLQDASSEWRNYIAVLKSHLSALRGARARLARATAKSAIFAILPGTDHVATLREGLAASSTRAATASALAGKRKAFGLAQRRQTVLSSLPAAPDLSASQARKGLALRLAAARRSLDSTARRGDLLKRLPAVVPKLTDTSATIRTLAQLAAARQRLANTQAALDTVTASLDEARKAVDQVVEDSDGMCPTCGGAVTALDLLKHSHTLGVSA